MKETKRRSMCSTEEGMACGPFCATAVDAEIVVEDEGKTVYLHGQWVDEVSDEVFFEATKVSVYDLYEQIYKSDAGEDDDVDEGVDEDALFAAKEEAERQTVQDWFPDCDLDERYAAYYLELKKMIQSEIDENDLDYDLFEDDED